MSKKYKGIDKKKNKIINERLAVIGKIRTCLYVSSKYCSSSSSSSSTIRSAASLLPQIVESVAQVPRKIVPNVDIFYKNNAVLLILNITVPSQI